METKYFHIGNLGITFLSNEWNYVFNFVPYESGMINWSLYFWRFIFTYWNYIPKI